MKATLSNQQKKVAWEIANQDITGKTIAEIAEEHSTTERTIYRWKNDPDFALELEAVTDVGMKSFYADSMKELRKLITKGHSEQAKLGGIKLVMQQQGKLREVQEITSNNSHDIKGGLSVEEIRNMREYLNDTEDEQDN